MEKKVVEVRILDLYDSFEGSLDFVIQKLIEYKATYEATGHSELAIDKEYAYGDASDEYYLRGKRLEDDREFATRMKAEEKEAERVKQMKLNEEEKEYNYYLRLKKKFEK